MPIGPSTARDVANEVARSEWLQLTADYLLRGKRLVGARAQTGAWLVLVDDTNGRARAVAGWWVFNEAATVNRVARTRGISFDEYGQSRSSRLRKKERPAMIDYGNRDEAYKAEWMTERRILRHLTLHNRRRPVGIAGAARQAIGDWVHRPSDA